MYQSINILKKYYLLTMLLFLGITIAPNVAIASNTYGPIKTGDMLWNIAIKARYDSSISRYQAMIALLKANPHAFSISCNLNTLKIGQILHIPSPTAMQALSRTEAIREFDRQQRAWHRRRKQTIVCSQKLPSAIHQPITQIARFKPTTITPTMDLPIAVNSQDNYTPITINQETIIPPEIVSIWNNVLTWFATQLPSPLVNFLTVVVLLLLLLLITVLRKSTTAQILNKKFTSKSTTIPQNEYHTKTNNEDSILASESINSTTNKNNNFYTEMKGKLDHVKAYLAGSETQTTQRILREVIQKGTSEQKDEAKQLYEINKRMDFLKQFSQEKTPNSTFSKIAMANSPDWQKNEHLQSQQQYLPENSEKVSELVDKIFELLDHELNAEGKLFNAYVQRQPETLKEESQSYEIVDKNAKLVDDEDVTLAQTVRPEPKPTRFL